MTRTESLVKLLMLWAVMFMFAACNSRDNEEPARYEISYMGEQLKWTGLNITGPGREEGIVWVTGYNYNERFIYGRTPVKYFLIDTVSHALLEFNEEEKLKESLSRFKVEFKELIKVPILKVPDLSYGYCLGVGGYWGPTYLVLQKSVIGLVNYIRRVSAVDDYIIVEGESWLNTNMPADKQDLESNKKWFAFHMPTDTKYIKNSLEELSAAIKVDKRRIESNMIEVYDYDTNKLPFEGYKASRYTETTHLSSVHDLIIQRGSRGRVAVRFIEYYKQEPGYIFGKAKYEYFVFNTKNERCFYYAQKEDWLKKLKELGLTPSNFTETHTVTPELDSEPWERGQPDGGK